MSFFTGRKRKLDARTLVRMIDQGLDIEHYIKTGKHRYKKPLLKKTKNHNPCLGTTRLFGSKKTTTPDGKREYQKFYMRKYRERQKQGKKK